MEAESLISLMISPPDEQQVALVIAPQAVLSAPGRQEHDLILVEPAGGVPRLRISLGSPGALSPEAFRRCGGSAARWLIQRRIASAGFYPGDLTGPSINGTLEAFCEGLLLGGFRFEHYKTTRAETAPITVHIFESGDPTSLEALVRRVTAVASGVNLARRLANEPPNIINPLTLADYAAGLAERDGLTCRALDEVELAQLGAGALLAVGQGSRTPPRLIVLEYPGQGAQTGAAPVVLVGKALTFDSGGYMVKDRQAIVGMKYDKAGGAAVLGALHAAALLRLEAPLVGIIPAAENMISAEAYRPDDVLRSLSGKMVEVNNTDAEGRLVLCDALTYACWRCQPRALIDIATLTYGVVTALGKLRAGLMSNDDALADDLLEAGERSGERLWRLPLDLEYLELLHSDVADLKNYSGSSAASPVTGGIFLEQFIPHGVPWAHLDILGTATTVSDLLYCPKGATGFGVRLLMDYLTQMDL
jgi:leucyl aminopeptidase